MKARYTIKKIELKRFFFYLIPLLILPSLSWAWQGPLLNLVNYCQRLGALSMVNFK